MKCIFCRHGRGCCIRPDFILATASPAIAISADLAKKCRELAVKSHPPAPAGTAPYAQAERDFFRDCISKGDDAKDNGPQKAPPAGPL